MLPLEKALRNKLERTVKDARDIAEAAARGALEQLGVGEASPYAHLTEAERQLRRKLRIHGRQLGDSLNGKVQTMDRLIEEVAYEHWHRMLFARFLAENNLLMYPDPDDPVAVTLEECEDLAADEGAQNGWELAARFAAHMLPQIFRPDSPVFQLVLPPEHQQKLERLVAGLPAEVFTASDSLGWVYQFWQAKKKEEIIASEVKIGARELPAVTQLFTEPYMVAFLLDNSLGAWWAGRRLTESDLKNAASEDELRAKAALPGMPLEYLRFVKREDGAWTPAAGTFDGWPKHLSELKTLDPCCGSGHFLVAAFLMLVAMRMALEALSAREAIDAVLRQNIHGLEIDQRCVELAAFALALTAWRYPDAGGYRPLPELNVACSGLAISAKKEEWLALAGDNTNLRLALEELYKQFKDAPILGSLINPEASLGKDSLFELKWEEVGPVLTKALTGERDDKKAEMGVVASGIAKAANILTMKYQLMITNVPFVGTLKQDKTLKTYCEKYHPKSKHDLSTCLIERSVNLLNLKGTAAFVSPHNWLFLGAYKAYRTGLLKYAKWNFSAFLGPRSFQTPMYDFGIALTVITNDLPDIEELFRGINVEKLSNPSEKADALSRKAVLSVYQAKQLNNPDQRVSLTETTESSLLLKFADGYKGLSTGDLERFIHMLWECMWLNNGWVPLQGSPQKSELYTGRNLILKWDEGQGEMVQASGCYLKGQKVWNRRGISVGQTTLKSTLYRGEKFNENAAVICPFSLNNLPAIWCYCSSDEFPQAIRKVDRALKVTNKTLVKVPFDLAHWTKVAQEKYPNGLPEPYSDDPTQWIFHGHPAQSGEPLQVAVGRLLGYRWPAELDSAMELSEEAHAWVKKSEALLPFADEDGIVCIPPVRGEASAADRLLNLLARAYGDTWSNDKLAHLLNQADHAGKTLETWLREKFFTQHCKLFHHRPFIWHIWDGLRDGFAALVNYHKFDHKNLETLIYAYLGDWISTQKDAITHGIDGAGEKLAAAENLKKRLELILEGEAPYDIFVRWKPIDKQPIGWDPDLNDGVRLNIRPFLSVPDVGKRGAGVLRDKPNIKWEKDRGKDVASAPWYHLGPHYGGHEGDRINDHHLALAEKDTARKANIKEAQSG